MRLTTIEAVSSVRLGGLLERQADQQEAEDGNHRCTDVRMPDGL